MAFKRRRTGVAYKRKRKYAKKKYSKFDPRGRYGGGFFGVSANALNIPNYYVRDDGISSAHKRVKVDYVPVETSASREEEGGPAVQDVVNMLNKARQYVTLENGRKVLMPLGRVGLKTIANGPMGFVNGVYDEIAGSDTPYFISAPQSRAKKAIRGVPKNGVKMLKWKA